MFQRTFLAIVFLTLMPTNGQTQQNSQFFIESRPARKVEATLTLEVRFANGEVKEWEVVIAKPPSLPSQTISKVVVEPTGEELNDSSDLKQPVFRIYQRVETEAQKRVMKVVVRTEATLMARKLMPLPLGMKRPDVSPLNESERKAALVSSNRENHTDETFQKWLDTNQLRRQKNESDLDFAVKVFRTIKQKIKYKERPFDHDGKASSTGKSGQGDCSCIVSVFVSALRANDIPAHKIAGRIVKSDKPFDRNNDYGKHVRAEFFVDQVGWIPLDPTEGIADRSPTGLNFFGNDAGDFLVLHFDDDLVVESKTTRNPAISGLQNPHVFWRGEGKLNNPEVKEVWKVRQLPLNSK